MFDDGGRWWLAVAAENDGGGKQGALARSHKSNTNVALFNKNIAETIRFLVS